MKARLRSTFLFTGRLLPFFDGCVGLFTPSLGSVLYHLSSRAYCCVSLCGGRLNSRVLVGFSRRLLSDSARFLCLFSGAFFFLLPFLSTDLCLFFCWSAGDPAVPPQRFLFSGKSLWALFLSSRLRCFSLPPGFFMYVLVGLQDVGLEN